MHASRTTRLMAGITLVTVPTIVYGGLTLLGVLTRGRAGLPAGIALDPEQAALWRAGHAHAGVLLLLSLLIQLLLDDARLPAPLAWSARVAAPGAAVLVSAGFFGVAHLTALAAVLYAGTAALVFSVLVTGVGLIRSARP